MDPRHKLYKTLDNLSVDPDPDIEMSGTVDEGATQSAPDSGVAPDVIKRKLEEALEATYVEVEDLSGMCAARSFYAPKSSVAVTFMSSARRLGVFERLWCLGWMM